jgi:6-phosphogluconolactonase
MRSRPISRFVVGLALLAWAAQPAAADEAPAGAVYCMTNDPEGNAVVAFARGADGALTKLGTFPTGGKGVGVDRLLKNAPDNGIDSLTSNASLVLNGNGHVLFAVNAGSDTITSFQVRADSTLVAVATVPTGGRRPNGIALSGDLLYVANAGMAKEGVPATLTGFRVDPDGRLVAISESSRTLSDPARSFPAHILFSPKGDFLVATELVTNKVTLYRVSAAGLLSRPVSHDSAGKDPFGATFLGPYRLFVTEAQGGALMGGKGKATSSSYALDVAGRLATTCPEVANGQTAACWAVATCDGRFVLTSNTDAGTVSCYAVDAAEGTIKLQKGEAASLSPAKGETSGPIDAALSRDGRFFYQLYAGNGAIGAYRIEKDGGLTPLDRGEAKGLPQAAGIQGMVAW